MQDMCQSSLDILFNISKIVCLIFCSIILLVKLCKICVNPRCCSSCRSKVVLGVKILLQLHQALLSICTVLYRTQQFTSRKHSSSLEFFANQNMPSAKLVKDNSIQKEVKRRWSQLSPHIWIAHLTLLYMVLSLDKWNSSWIRLPRCVYFSQLVV